MIGNHMKTAELQVREGSLPRVSRVSYYVKMLQGVWWWKDFKRGRAQSKVKIAVLA